jgi:hypothetical protein
LISTGKRTISIKSSNKREKKKSDLGRLRRIHWFVTIRSQKIGRLFFVITAAKRSRDRCNPETKSNSDVKCDLESKWNINQKRKTRRPMIFGCQPLL